MIERIDLKVGFACNNLCQFCVQGDKRERLPAKPLAELKKSLEEGRRSGAKGVVFTGGEPSLHPHILGLVRAAKRLGYETIQLQSNGRTFCYTETVRKFIAAGVNEFGPALHGSRPEIHDFLTGAPGSFLQVVSGMRNIKKLGQRLITNTVITKANYRDLPDLARLLVSLGVDQYQFAFMHITGRAASHREWLTARKSIIEPWVKKGLDVGIEAGLRVMTEAIPYCFMSGYEDSVAERIIPQTKIFDAESVIEDYSQVRRTEGKAKGPHCPACVYFKSCEGPWREYPEMFGWDEFQPVDKQRHGADRRGQGGDQRRAIGPMKAAKILDLSIASGCHNKCIFCANVKKKMPLLETGKILQKLEAYRRAGYDGLDLSAKEFTLRKDAVEILLHARNLGFSLIHLITNGHMFADYATMAGFLESGINQVSLSLHSDNQATEAKITGNPESFQKKLAAIKNILRYAAEQKGGVLFEVNTVMTPLTASRMDRIMSFVAQQGVRRHNLYFPQIHPHMLAVFDQTVPHFSEIGVSVSRGLDLCLPRGTSYSIVDVPPCILPRHLKMLNLRLRKTIAHVQEEKDFDEKWFDVRQQKRKGPPCRLCPQADRCEGVFTRYVNKRGWGEFLPAPFWSEKP